MIRLRPRRDTSWATYLQRFHGERAGITERVLSRCVADGLDPYEWCAQPFAPTSGRILDVACGSGPLAEQWRGWIGTDASLAELSMARDRRRRPLVQASAAALPIRTGSLDAAVCCMAVQIIDPLRGALAELARVVRPGGRVVLLLPSNGPVPWRDAVIYLRLQAVLRRRIRYPNDQALLPTHFSHTAANVGLPVASDERRGFALPLSNGQQVDEFLASLYLLDIDPDRIRAGRRVLAPCIGHELTVPLRRIVLERTEGAR